MVLKKNDEIQLEITSLTSQGSGVGHFDGMAVFVQNTAVGDVVLAHIIKVKSSYAVAIIKSIIKPSPDRIEPDCSVFGKCGGCAFRHISYASELEAKKQFVQSALERIGGLNIKVEEILHAKSEHYRNKAQYPVRLTQDGKMQIGFYSRRSHRIIDCRNCLLQPQYFVNILNAIEAWQSKTGVSCYNESKHSGVMRHVYVRKSFSLGETMVCLVINAEDIPDKNGLIERLKKADSTITSVVLNINKKDTNVVLGEKCVTIWGRDYIEDTLCGLKFHISPLSFYQVNPRAAKLLYEKARQYAELKKDEILLDLYCGTGTIGLIMAKDAGRVIGAEIIEQAVADAKENAKLNGIENADFICVDAEEAAKTLFEKEIKPDVVVLDPPRKGCSPQVLSTVSKMQPRRIVYVSCDPATLARDLKIFASLGYNTKKVTAVDMFPRTAHVETVCQLVLEKPVGYVNTDAALDETVCDK